MNVFRERDLDPHRRSSSGSEEMSTAKIIGDQIRSSGSLIERLEMCRRRIAKLTAERSAPKITIPPRWDDDDMFICCTLVDAIKALRTPPQGQWENGT